MKLYDINGTRLLYHYVPNALTNIQILTNVGSSVEKPHEYGLAHILEHCFFKASQKYPNPGDIEKSADNIGGVLNAWTNFDATCYHITVLNQYFDQGLDILTDMYQHPLFPEEEVQKELNPILSEFRRYEDDPNAFFGNRLNEAIFGSVAHNIVGNEKSIKTANRSKLLTFRKKYYGAQNCLISIVGGVKLPQVLKQLRKNWHLPKAAVTPAFKPPTYSAPPRFHTTKKGTQEALYSLVFPTWGRGHTENNAQNLMNFVLGGYSGGLLFKRIRDVLGLSCYGIYSYIQRQDAFNYLGIDCGIAPNQLEVLHKEVLEIIEHLCNEPISEDLLLRAKNHLLTSNAQTMQSPEKINNAVAGKVLKGADPAHVLDNSGVQAVTVEEILAIAQATFQVPYTHCTLLPS